MVAKTGVKQDLQRLVTEHVQENPGPFTIPGVTKALGRSRGSVQVWLEKLTRDGHLLRSKTGEYVYHKNREV